MEKVKWPFLQKQALCHNENPRGTDQIQLAQDYEQNTLIKTRLAACLGGLYLPRTSTWLCLLKCEEKWHNITQLSSQH